MTDLWPDFSLPSTIKPPKAILEEQSQILARKTGGVVEGSVRIGRVQQVREIYSRLFEYRVDFEFSFSLHSSILTYTTELFSIFHPVEMYPIYFVFTDDVEYYGRLLAESGIGVSPIEVNALGQSIRYSHVDNEENFLNLLRIIFNSGKITNIINALVRQS